MRLRHWLEYAGLRFGLLLIDVLPLAATARLGAWTADLWYGLNGRRRRIAIDNLLRSGIATNAREAARIARRSFRHLPLLVLESLQSSRFFNEDTWEDRVAMDVSEEALEVFKEPGRGVIMVSGHLGNWEIAAQLLSYLKPVTGITRGMNNPLNDRLLRSRKPRNRFTLTPMHDANPGRLFEVLKKGEVLALLTDQHARRRGMMVDFFGTPASTHTSPALLHLVTGAPICFGYCVRTGPMTFKLVAPPPIRHTPTGDRQADIRAILEALNRALEEAIRRHPDQYLWVHRRWRDRQA